MELTVTYNIEVTEVIKDPGTIAAIMADTEENMAAEQRLALRGSFGEDDLHVYGVKRFYNEESAV